MGLIGALFTLFGTHPSIVSFFGAFIAGGETIVGLAILSAQNIMPWWIVFIFCSLGIYCSDLLWFSIGKIKALSYLKRYGAIKKGYKHVVRIVEKTHSPFVLLSMTKFIYGIGIPAIMYLGRKKYSYKQFMRYNAAIILSWSAVLVLLGWLAGKGFEIFYKTYKNLEISLLILAILMLIIYMGKVGISKWISKKEHLEDIK